MRERSFSVVQNTTTGRLSSSVTRSAQVLDPAHDRHVPVQQHHIGHAFHTHIQRHLTIFGLGNVEPEFLKYFAGNHSDNFGIVHNKASFHILYPAY
tara:strand:- start:92 stop:379 length:288 start_codon:yes stop_codon:yes gene_type:complete